MGNFANFINGRWRAGSGPSLRSVDPYRNDVLWEKTTTTRREVEDAVAAARIAFYEWSRLSLEQRLDALHRFQQQLEQHSEEMAELISREVGKPLWESRGEVGAMAKKIGISIEAFAERCRRRAVPFGQATSVTRFKPHGVVAVFGPFNLPGHLPNGHIIPALLAGNTVVFKPSELTPAVGERVVELWEASGLPAGVINLVQGDREVGEALAAAEDIDGLFFTGSSATGQAIHESYAGAPETILALEMGGNNPLVVHRIDDVEAAVYWTIQSAFITSGQRCVCARRLIVTDAGPHREFLDRLIERLPQIRVGHYTQQPEPFLGPVISTAAADRVLAWQEELAQRGGSILVPVEKAENSETLLRPGLMDATSIKDRPDVEIFGPFLQLIRVDDLDEAIIEASRTVYGLAAGIFSKYEEDYETFRNRIRSGIVNWNQPLTGASSAAPFGGVGQSGNHNPSAYFAADYCSYPVASMECPKLQMPGQKTPGME